MKEKQRRSPRFNGKRKCVYSGLSPKEITVLSMLGYGLSVKEISAAEKVGEKAIECRKASVAKKLKFDSFCPADFVRMSIAMGLTPV